VEIRLLVTSVDGALGFVQALHRLGLLQTILILGNLGVRLRVQ